MSTPGRPKGEHRSAEHEGARRSVLLHISDPHFGTEQAPVVEALLAFAASCAPDAIVISGDITQRARSAQFRAARAFVDRLAPHACVVVPGNHDIPLFNLAARLFSPYAGYRRVFGADLEPLLDRPGLLVVGLNTTRPWRRVDGELAAAQVERAARRFEAASPGQLRVAVVHQPVAVTDPADLTNLLHGRAAAVRRWAEAGCDLILGGHIHLPFIVELETRFAPLARPLWAVQAGTAVSSRVRGDVPNSFNLIRHEAGPAASACNVERWDWQAAAGAFARVQTTPLALAPRRSP